jgi:hypothetical protein
MAAMAVKVGVVNTWPTRRLPRCSESACSMMSCSMRKQGCRAWGGWGGAVVCVGVRWLWGGVGVRGGGGPVGCVDTLKRLETSPAPDCPRTPAPALVQQT